MQINQMELAVKKSRLTKSSYNFFLRNTIYIINELNTNLIIFIFFFNFLNTTFLSPSDLQTSNRFSFLFKQQYLCFNLFNLSRTQFSFCGTAVL